MPKLFETMDKIRPAYDLVYKVFLVICKLLLITDICITSYTVLGRWCQTWARQYPDVLGFLSVLKVLDILADVAVLALGLIMLVEGWKYASTLGGRGFYVSMPWLSRFWMYFPVPLAGVAMIVFELEALYNHIKSFFVKEGEVQA